MKRVFTRKERKKKTDTDNDDSSEDESAPLVTASSAAAVESIDGFEINEDADPEHDAITTHLTASTRVT